MPTVSETYTVATHLETLKIRLEITGSANDDELSELLEQATCAADDVVGCDRWGDGETIPRTMWAGVVAYVRTYLQAAASIPGTTNKRQEGLSEAYSFTTGIDHDEAALAAAKVFWMRKAPGSAFFRM